MHIEVNVAAQILTLYADEKVLMSFPVATAKKGVGEQNGSEQTPRGWHYIRAKIGADQPENTVFAGIFTGHKRGPCLGRTGLNH